MSSRGGRGRGGRGRGGSSSGRGRGKAASGGAEHRAKHRELNSVSSQLAGVIEGLKSQLQQLDAELAADRGGAKEYQDEIDKLNRRKRDLQKRIKKNQDWCDQFDAKIGGVQEKYDHFLDDMDVLYDNAVVKHAKGLQQLVEDFNYHPLFKHHGDTFSAVPFRPLRKEQL